MLMAAASSGLPCRQKLSRPQVGRCPLSAGCGLAFGEQIASIDKACFVGGPMGKLGSSTMTALVLAWNIARAMWKVSYDGTSARWGRFENWSFE